MKNNPNLPTFIQPGSLSIPASWKCRLSVYSSRKTPESVFFSRHVGSHNREGGLTANWLAGGSLQQRFCLWQGDHTNGPLRVANFCQQKDFFLLHPPRLFLISCAAEGNSSLKLPPDSKICFSRHLCLQPPRTVGDKTLFFLLLWPTNLFCKGQLWFGTLRLSYSLQAGLLLLWACILLLLRVQTYLSFFVTTCFKWIHPT